MYFFKDKKKKQFIEHNYRKHSGLLLLLLCKYTEYIYQ